MATKITTRVLADNAVTDAKIADVTLTTATQSASDNTTKIATTAYVTTAIANLADSAPSTLNTLNELAAALGDDANYATTTTNAIAAKLPLAGGTLTGALTGTSFNDGYVTWSGAQFNRYGAAIELQFTPTNTATLVKIGGNGSNPTIFNAHSGDASFAGDVLIGNTTVQPSSQHNNQAGFGYDKSVSQLQIATTTNNAPMELSRNSSNDGNWITFRKQNNVLGNIGTYGGTLYVGSTNGGLMFNGTDIEPTTGGVSRVQGTIDLGSTTYRFKDGHFAGSLYAHGGQFVIATDSGGSYMGKADNATLRLITNNTTRITIRNDGGIGIGNNNPGYSSQVLSVKSASADEVFYGESTDANCFAVFRDNSSNTNVGFGAIGNDHVFRNDSVEKWRMQSSTGYLIGQSASNMRIVLGSTGNSSNNTSNWVRGNAGYLQFNSASSGYNWEIAGNSKMAMTSTGALTVENGQTYALTVSGNGAGLRFSTGTNQRIYWNTHRAMEGAADGSTLQVGEGFTNIALQGHVGAGGQTAPKSGLDVDGAITMSNGDLDLLTHTYSTYASRVGSGCIKVTAGYSASLGVGRKFIFKYNAVSWKAFHGTITLAATTGFTKYDFGGYWNNSGSAQTNGYNSAGAGIAVTFSGQAVVVTLTTTSSMTHPMVSVEYHQSGGDGPPRLDRAEMFIQ